MLAIYLILGFFFLIYLLLSLPVKFIVAYHTKFQVKLSWCGICWDFSKPKKQLSVSKTGKKSKKKKEKIKPIKKKNLFQGFFETNGSTKIKLLLKKGSQLLLYLMKKMHKHIKIQKLFFTMVLPGEDPEALTEQYGRYCAVLFPVFGWISSSFCTKKGNIRLSITPDYTNLSEATKSLDFELVVIPLKIFFVLVVFSCKSILCFFSVIKNQAEHHSSS